MSDPANLNELLDERARLSKEIQDIQIQLADRDKRKEDGTKLSYTEYQEWRKKALWALNKKQQRMADLKAFIHKASTKKTNDLSMLEKAFKLLRFIKDEEGLHAAEEPTVNEIEQYLRDRGVAL